MNVENNYQIENEEATICANCKHFGEIPSWFRKDIPFGYLKNSGECRFNPPKISEFVAGIGLATSQ